MLHLNKRKTPCHIYTTIAHRWKLAPLATPDGRKRKQLLSNTNGRGEGLLHKLAPLAMPSTTRRIKATPLL